MSGWGGARATAWAAAIGGGAVSMVASTPAPGKTFYDAVVAPIFATRCVECHGPDKQKAELVLDSWAGAAKGSDAGPIWVAGKPAESELLRRMRLPLDDEERMPPKDRPQPDATEIELIARWIERGATAESRVEALGLSDELRQAAAELPAKLASVVQVRAEPLWEYDPEEVRRARAPLAERVAQLQRRFPGCLTYESRTSADLHFVAVGMGRDFGDRELAEVATAVGDAVVVLDVSMSGVTDAAAPSFAQMRGLRVMRASFTAVGDGVVEALGGAPKLEAVVLPATRVSEASVAVLGKLPRLRKLWLADTAIVEAARAARLPLVEAPAHGQNFEGISR